MQTNEICMQVIRTIRNYLHDPDCLSPHRKEKCFVRKRSLSMLQVIQFLFYSSKASMCQNLASIISDFPDIDFPKVSKQAVSKARQGIKPSLFRDLFNLSVDVFYKNVMVIPVSSLKVILTMIQMTLKSALLKLLLMTVQRNILLLT